MDERARSIIRILAVEDAENQQKLYQEQFGKFSDDTCYIQVDIVNNVVDALIQLCIETYHLITIDNQLYVRNTNELRDDEGKRLAFILSEQRWFMTRSFALHSALITNFEQNSRFVRTILNKYDVQTYIKKGEELADELSEVTDGQIFKWMTDWKKKPRIEIDTEAKDKFESINQIDVQILKNLPFTPNPLDTPENLPTLDMLPTIDLKRRTREELYILIQRLFPDATEVILTPINEGRSATQVYSLRHFEGDKEHPDTILKVGSPRKIEEEYQNYMNYVSRKINNDRVNIGDKGFQRTQLMGGIVYTFLRTLDSFKTFYDTNSSERVKQVLHNLFEHTTDHWYQPGWQKRGRYSLFQLYDRLFHITQDNYVRLVDNVIERMVETGQLRVSDAELYFTRLKGIATDFPFINVIKLMKEKPEIRRTIMLGITHGDFNEQNIFVHPLSCEAYLIDFQHTGEHHAARDFIRLEVAIKMYLLEISSLAHYYHMESLLVSSRRFDEVSLNNIRAKYQAPNEAYRKAFDSILELRRLANEKAHVINNDYEDYFIGLMMAHYATLRYIEETRQNAPEEEYRHFDLRQQATLLSSSMLAAQLEKIY